MMLNMAPPVLGDDPVEYYDHLLSALHTVGNHLGLIKSRKICKIDRSNQQWFDRNCRTARWSMRKAYRKYKRLGCPEALLQTYLEKKKEYRSILKDTKTNYFNNLQEKFRNTHNSGDFWKAVKTLRTRKSRSCKLDLDCVEKFYSVRYQPAAEAHAADEHAYSGSYDPELDGEITLTELKGALSTFGDHKAAGTDGVSYEFYKGLPAIWLRFILKCFNLMLSRVSVPSALAKIRTFLLFKKGDESDPGNYRGISLLNTLLKIFNQILLNRLQAFSLKNNLLPENQNGFRKGRGCQDNIFVLSSLITMGTRAPKSKVFIAFIDFLRAFDNLNHEILWKKLASKNVSARYINLLKSLYSNASFCVKINDKETQPYSIGAGILQGDVTSPILFALFLADLDNFLEGRGLRGISVSGTCDVLSLCYADDLCLVTYSYVEMKRTLEALAHYCETNDLKVNHSKSAIMVCRKRGSVPRFYRFCCGDDNIAIVPSYNYLGVTFSSSGLFNKNATVAVGKGEVATKSVQGLLYRVRNGPLSSWLKV
ncbi:unnamed protein product, partial [Nesidiocoris tenuis]